MKQKLISLTFFLIIFSLFEIILAYPRFIYIFIGLLGIFSIFVFFKLKKRIDFNYRIFLWLAAGFFYLLTSLFFIIFVSEALLRHILAFLSTFLIVFWLGRFYRFLQIQIYRQAIPTTSASDVLFKEIDVFLFRVLSLSSFYFGISSIYGGSLFLNIHPLLLLGVFILIVLFCTILFWEAKISDVKDTRYFFWGLITILSAELLFAVYFLPLPIFSLAAIVFLFWFFLTWILYDYSLGIFEFKKYKTKLILFLVFIVIILSTIEW